MSPLQVGVPGGMELAVLLLLLVIGVPVYLAYRLLQPAGADPDGNEVEVDRESLGRWWYGNAATVALGALAFASIVVSAILQSACGQGGCGENGFALLAVVMFFGMLIVGYASIVTLWLDAQNIRQSGASYSPKVWLYALGYLFLSPWLSSVVYLVNRRRALSHATGAREH